jgi:ABC transporter DrrB family efflux protein
MSQPTSLPLGGPFWTVSDALVMTKRSLIQIIRQPDGLFFTVIQPIIFVLLFAYVFGGAIPLPGGGSYREFVIDGIFVQTVVFGSATTGVGFADDLRKGLIDRFRSLPMARSALLFGRTAGDLVRNALTIVIMALIAWAVGWHIHNGFPKAVAGFALLLLFAYAVSWIGTLVGLLVGTPEAATGAGLAWAFPVVWVSNAFVPSNGMPGWLKGVAEWNPISAVVSACRTLFGNPNPVTHPHILPMLHPVLVSIGWSILLIIVFAPLAVNTYRKITPN